jgi:ATP-dependent Lhr-like helicase
MDIFDRYAPFIQDFIYENRWENLRAIQVAAGEAIFNTDQNVLLCASTASGKTEAAFFPILTLFSEDEPRSVGCIYVAPLKALINDQFLRLNDLCRDAQIPVWHWHGDVSASEKKRLMKKPSGILQITPESLEALLMHKHADIPSLFGDLRFVVIDEIHSMLRGDRGGQTLCLIERLSRLAGVQPRRIGLSATIGDTKKAGAFLSAGSGRGCVIPRIETKGVQWRLSMEHFYNSAPQADEAWYAGSDTVIPGTVQTASLSAAQADREEQDTAASHLSAIKEEPAPVILAPPGEATDKAPYAADPGCGYIFEHTRGKKCLVFTNSREECEAVTTTLRQYCEKNHEPDRFLIHHGNLATSFRQSAEEQMKDDDNRMTICTTSTLELGIDIGRLERAFQVEAPFTVSSFLQRMGRTGRRGEPCEMWFVMREEHAEPRDLFPDTIPWSLIQGIALVQLYLEERWVEPPRDGRLPYSLLYHQTMSTLASCGEMTPRELASRVLTLAYFNNVTAEDYKVLLRHLLETDQIQWTEEGGLIVGLAGERITNSFKFYAVFQENEEYSVRCESEEIGTIVKPPPVGERIAIAGHVWVCEEVDRVHHQVYVHMIKGNVPAYFGDEPGDIHTRILERMAQVLRENTDYPYLRKHAKARLFTARRAAAASGMNDRPLICLGEWMYCLFPWLGSYAFLALERLLRLRCADRLGLKGFNSVRPYFIQFTLGVSEAEFFRILGEEAEKPFDPMELLYPKEVPVFDKYDDLLPEELVRKGFAYGVLDIEGMKRRVREWADRYGQEV